MVYILKCQNNVMTKIKLNDKFSEVFWYSPIVTLGGYYSYFESYSLSYF